MGGLSLGTGPTAFDAITSAVAATLYLVIGVAAFLHAPRDSRVRLFLVTVLASLAPYLVTTAVWTSGTGILNRAVVALVAVSLTVGSLALFHFLQTFPWRRPWIRAHGTWLAAGYLVLPLAAAFVVWKGPGVDTLIAPNAVDPYGQVSLNLIAALLLISIPLLVLVGIVIPFAALVSLYKSWQAATEAAIEAARVTTLWILISQLAGGVLTILVIPLLDLAAPHGWWTRAAAALLFGFALLMPVAFALGVWKYRVLEIDPDRAPVAL